MPRPTIANRRAAILDAAEAMIIDQGFDGVTIAEVARRVGIAKGAVYLEFPSKGAILQALLNRSTHRLTRRTRQTLDDLPDADLTLGRIYRAGIEALLDDRLATAALLDDRGILGSQVQAFGPDRYTARMAWLRLLLQAFADGDALAPDLDIDGLAIALGSITIGLVSASTTIGPLTEEQITGALDAVAAIVERGVQTAPPRRPEELRSTLTWILDRMLDQTADTGQTDGDGWTHADGRARENGRAGETEPSGPGGLAPSPS